MKKLFVITGVLIGMTLLATGTHAQDTKATGKTSTVQTSQAGQPSGKFVDKNGDGICDHMQQGGKTTSCANFTDKNGNGVCDNCCKDGKTCCKSNCCGTGNSKNCCSGMGKGNCCGKGNRHQHGMKGCTDTIPSQPEKK